MREPAAGPNARDTATARLSSTTGDGVTLRERVVERRDARPIGVRGVARARMARRDRRLQRVRPARAA